MEQLCYRPSVIAYTIVLRAYGQVGKIKLAEEIFLEMLDAGCEPDEIACGTMLCTYARWGRHKAMLAFYTALQERDVILSVAVYNFMLSSLQKKSLHQNVIQIYKDMVNKQVVPNHFTFTVVICSLVKEGLLEEGLAAFNRMKSLGFEPEEVTYSLLIICNVKEGKKDEVLTLYEDMKYRNIIPSNFTCASLLSLYYRSGDYSKALSLFSEMERYKIRADEVIYGLLVRIYGKLGLYEDAEKTFEEAERLGLLSDEKTYIAMAQVHIGSGEYVKGLHIMELMRSRNIPFSRFAYAILLKCYIMKEDLASAETTFQSLSSAGVLDTISCNDMLNLFLRKALFEKAKNFIVQIRKDNVVFDEELCRTVMKVYSKEGMLREAEQFIEEICGNKSLENSSFIQTIAVILHAQDGKLENEKGLLLAPGVLDSCALESMLCLYLASGDDMKTEYVLHILLEAADGLSDVNQLIGKFIREGNIGFTC